MAFDTIEESVKDGKPIEFFKFARNDSVWLYTTAIYDTEFNSETYSSIPIRRSTLREEKTRPESRVTIYMPVTTPFIFQFISQSPSDNIAITIYYNHVGESDGEALTIFKGRVVNIKHGENEGEVVCEPLLTALGRPVLRRFYQRNCPYQLYDTPCSVDPDSFKVTGTLTGVSANTVSADEFDAQPDGYFDGGFLEFELPDGNFDRRMITKHEGDTLTLAYHLPSVSSSDTVVAFAGCDHTIATCDSKFSNKANYGGFPFFPSKNIMGGEKIF